MTYSLTVNGTAYSVESKPDMPLVWVLRDLLGRGAVMIGCGRGNCGACTVRLNGDIIHSCSLSIEQDDGGVVTTPGYRPAQS